MDLLGMEGEKAAQGIRSIADRIDEVESHLNAVDNAVQDLSAQVERSRQTFVSQRQLTQMLETPDDQEQVSLEQLRSFFVQLSEDQSENSRRIRLRR